MGSIIGSPVFKHQWVAREKKPVDLPPGIIRMIEPLCARYVRNGCPDQSSGTGFGCEASHSSVRERTGIIFTRSNRTCEVIDKPDVFIPKVKRCLSCLPRMIAFPFRLCTTVLSVTCFTGYYVSVLTVTAVSALIGALAGLGIKLTGLPVHSTRPVSECALAFARKTFGWLSVPYEQASLQLAGSLFPAVLAVALFILETLLIPIKRLPIDVYKKLCHEVYEFTKPFQTVTDLTEELFKKTKEMI